MLTNLMLCWDCGALRPTSGDVCPHCDWKSHRISRWFKRALGVGGATAEPKHFFRYTPAGMAFDALYDGYRRIRKSLLVGTFSLSSLVLATLAWVEWEEFLHPGPADPDDRVWQSFGFETHPLPKAMIFSTGAVICLALAIGRWRRWEAPWRAPRSTLELMQEARARPFPYYLCVHCRLLIAYESCAGPCPQCHSKIDCLEILDAEELRIAEAALD